jgi:hypothetical protein
VNRYPPDTIAILSADTLAEDIPAQLLQEEGYNTKVHEANATEAMDGFLDGVDVLVLAAGVLRRSGPPFFRSLFIEVRGSRILGSSYRQSCIYSPPRATRMASESLHAA